ncbi:MAG TPA: preprotein translocase subunit YajC [Chitinophagales bacterium]|nr:preprotein translocase subunit YajC [Chitinophagales bacterium]
MLTYILLQGTGQGSNPVPTLLLMAALFVVMYFFMIRPQTKKAKEQKKFISEIKKGDKVVTIGGIHGKVARVDDDTFLIEVDSNTKLRIEKSVISVDFTKAANARTGTEKENGK